MNPRETALENEFWPIRNALVSAGHLVSARPDDGIIDIMGRSTRHQAPEGLCCDDSTIRPSNDQGHQLDIFSE
jgi:hypothetical protein